MLLLHYTYAVLLLYYIYLSYSATVCYLAYATDVLFVLYLSCAADVLYLSCAATVLYWLIITMAPSIRAWMSLSHWILASTFSLSCPSILLRSSVDSSDRLDGGRGMPE